jgi:N-methylhydantoinase B
MTTAPMTEHQIDPVTFEILRHRLWCINDEHGQTVLKVSGSPHAVYAQDFNPGILTAAGEWVYFGPYVQFMSAGASSAIEWILEHRPNVAPGDTYVTNDPWVGTVHQQDYAVLEPVFVDGRLLCWVTNALHMYDVGGMSPGSYCPTARDVFDEPAILPPIKIREGGELRVDVQETIMRQSRVPKLVALDLNALMAGCHVARTRIEETCARYGAGAVEAAMEKIVGDAETVFVKRLEAIPDGVWRERSFIEVAAPGDRGVYANVLTIRKRGSELVFSNEGSSPAVASINQTAIAWRGAVVAALGPTFLFDQLYAIGGAMRHCRFEPVEGLINCAPWPFSVSNSSPCLSLNTVAVTYNCLSRMLVSSADDDRKLMAAGANSTMAVNIVSATNQWGDHVGRTTMDAFLGGIGAQDVRDGVDTGGHAWGPKAMAPNLEHNELHFPYLYLWRREAADSGGAGCFRGGNSASVCMVPHRAERLTHDVTAWGMEVPTSAGLFGGEPGAPNRIQLVRDTQVEQAFARGEIPRSPEALGGTPELLPQRAGGVVQGPRDAWIFEWCGGGGYGDPAERPPAAVEADVRAGHVSPEQARRAYGERPA